MSPSVPDESALLIRIPAAEPAVGRQRSLFDMAARVGVPAHITIAYPFKPVALLVRTDIDALTQLFGDFEPIEVTFYTTAWFGDEVLYLEPDNPVQLAALTAAVEAAFPEYPIYEGAHEMVLPHLTVGHSHPRDALAAAEREVMRCLPVTALVSEVELWRGPPPATEVGRWARVNTFPLGSTRSDQRTRPP